MMTAPIECRLVVLRPAEVNDQTGEGKGGAVIQRGEPGVSLEVGKRAQQDEVEDADQGEGVEDDDLAVQIPPQIVAHPAADQIEGEPLQLLHVHGHGLVPTPRIGIAWAMS